MGGAFSLFLDNRLLEKHNICYVSLTLCHLQGCFVNRRIVFNEITLLSVCLCVWLAMARPSPEIGQGYNGDMLILNVGIVLATTKIITVSLICFGQRKGPVRNPVLFIQVVSHLTELTGQVVLLTFPVNSPVRLYLPVKTKECLIDDS